MNTFEEICERFAEKIDGLIRLNTVPKDYPAYVYRNGDTFGVAIPYINTRTVSEHFSNVQLLSLASGDEYYLILTCTKDSLRNKFAFFCCQFVDTENDGNQRNQITDNPIEWWNQWKMLLGNASVNPMVYDVIGELEVLYRVYQSDKSAIWAADHAGTQDIETSTASYEVKSTINKYKQVVTISSENQLKKHHGKKLFLCFCVFEESIQGNSINDLVRNLVNAGYNRDLLDDQLAKRGFEKGASSRDHKFRINDRIFKYEINDSFPRLTKESFKDDKIPDRISHIVYDVDLSGMDYTEL